MELSIFTMVVTGKFAMCFSRKFLSILCIFQALGEGLAYERGGDARCLSQGCKYLILVSLLFITGCCGQTVIILSCEGLI